MDFETLGDWCKWFIFCKIGNKEDVIFYDAEPVLNILEKRC